MTEFNSGPSSDGRRRAIVIHPYLKSDERYSARSVSARLEEITGLALAIDLDVVGSFAAPLSEIRPATLIGKGKVEEIAEEVAGTMAELVICDGQLSPVQQRKIGRAHV